MRKLALPLTGLLLLFLVVVLVFLPRNPAGDETVAGGANPPSQDRPDTSGEGESASSDSPAAGASAAVPAVPGFVANADRSEKPTPPTAPPEPPSPKVWQQIEALQAAKANRTPVQQKLDSQLIDAGKIRRGEPVAEGVPTLRLELDEDVGGRVLTDLDAKVSDELLQRIADLGGEVVNHFAQFDAIRAWVPLVEVETLAARGDVTFIRPAVKAVTNVGSVTSEGDVAHGANVARTRFNVTGEGVKVGVLSDSVDHMAAAQASGDLGEVTVRTGQSGVPASGEGTAMLEIVHDLAPSAQLFYATGFGGPASFAQNIRDLRFQDGCDIIIDDVTYANESGFQDGVIAQAVNAVTDDGGLFFSSAANSGNKDDNTSGTWEGDFVDGGEFAVNGQAQGRAHSFGGSTQNIATKGGRINLFWADPLGASTNDYDVYVVNTAGDGLVAAGSTTQNGTQDPYEFVPKANDGERILIVKFSGEARFLHLDTGRGRLATSTSGSTRGHNASRDGFSVAAVDAKTSFPEAFTGNTKNPVETFSSDGLRRVFFQPDGTPITPGNFSSTGGTVWQKPDIAAADGVVTTLPGDSGLNPFFGTSAAAPHAGAVAALLKSYNPALTASQIRSILTGTALDIEQAGVDRNSGFGLVMAVPALEAVPGPDQPTIASFNPAAAGVGTKVILTGTKLNGVTEVRFNGVAATFTVDSATQISATVPAAATTGRITVTAPSGTATSGTDFTVQATPAITGLTPGSGAVGTTVTLSGAHFTGATAVRFNNVAAPGFTVNSAGQITVTVPAGATTGRVEVTTPAGTATSPGVFTVTTQPALTSFSPATGGVGTSVSLNGANLNGATAVRFNGVNASTFTVDSPIRITATVPAGATTGPVGVTTPTGTATSTAMFTVVPVPGITGLAPASGSPGANVTITGANFTGATAVRFNGVNASFTVRAAGQIDATVPAGATTGTVSVTTPGGTATSAAVFTVPVPPANDHFANAQSLAGASGTAAGNNAAATKEVNEPRHAGDPGGKSVWYTWTAPGAGAWQFTTVGSGFDTLLAVYTGSSVGALTLIASGDDTLGGTNSRLAFVASAGTVYRVAVDGFRGEGSTAASASSGNVVLNWAASTMPTISGFSPPSGAPGASVTITGANFTGATAVRFNGVTAAFTVNSALQITALVPANATSGPLEVSGPAGSAVSATEFAVVNAPANDAFAGARLLTGNSGSVSGRNTDASKEANEPAHAGNPGGRSIWYTWTAPANGLWAFDTVGSAFDTVLAVYTGNGVAALTLVTGNDDSSSGTSSRVSFNAVSGTAYRIAVDGRNGDSGNATLNWAFTPNPPSITSFAPSSGDIGSTVVLTGLNFTGATGVRLNGVLVSAFTVNSATQLTLTVPLGVNTGPFSVTTPNGTAVSPQAFIVTSGPANDQFAGAQLLSGSGAIVAGQNVTATRETGEPEHAGDLGGRSVWYRWTAPGDGTWAFDTAGTSFDTILGVYTGNTVNALTLVGSDDDAREDLTSRVEFDATAGTTYQIAVDGYGGANGNLALKLLPTESPEVIYETGFEAAEGFNGQLPLAGQGGWLELGGGGNGIVFDIFPGSGQQGYLGWTPPNPGENAYVWRPLNFTPQTNTRPVVRFSVRMGIQDSSNYAYDSFDWSVYDPEGERLFSLDFDNYDLNIYYTLDDNEGYFWTGGTFENGPIYELVITMDFARNRWIASLDGESLPEEFPISTKGVPRSLGDIVAVWYPADPFYAGNNAMVFDDYRVTAELGGVPAIVLPPQDQSVTTGSAVTFAVVASGGEPLHYQWQFNNSPLPGQTGPVLALDNVGSGQGGTYSVNVSNAVGSARGSATLAVNQPGPVRLTVGTLLPDGRFQFTVTGTPGTRAGIEFSPDLSQWESLTTVVIGDGSVTLADPDAGTQSRRYYRARLQP
ncbi:MAG: S8 family serine peptidase [Limisphaerales bacterium]